jgi:hypothetical protein
MRLVRSASEASKISGRSSISCGVKTPPGLSAVVESMLEQSVFGSHCGLGSNGGQGQAPLEPTKSR